MIISPATDFRETARRTLPPFLFHHLDGCAGQPDLTTHRLGQYHALPIALASIGLAGMP